MKPTKKGKVCLACRKRPMTSDGEIVGFCSRCRHHLILGGYTETEVIDPRSGQAWLLAELITSPRTTV
jgi:hypothetical protein